MARRAMITYPTRRPLRVIGGAHFGRLWTEELTMWRGTEPAIPGPLRR